MFLARQREIPCLLNSSNKNKGSETKTIMIERGRAALEIKAPEGWAPALMSSTAPGMKQMHEGEVKIGEMKRAHRVLTRYPQDTQGVLRGCSEGTQIAQEVRETVSGAGFQLSPPTLPIKQRKRRPRAAACATRLPEAASWSFEPTTIPRLPPHLHVVQYLYVLYPCVGVWEARQPPTPEGSGVDWTRLKP